MNPIKNTVLAVALLSLSFLHAQENTSITPETIDEKFTEVITTGGNYRNNGKVYRVIETYKLEALQKTTKSKIDELNIAIIDLKKQIADQKTAVDKVSSDLAQTQQTLSAAQQEKDTISFLGQPMSKGSYKTMMWSIAGVLLLFLLFFIYRFRNSHILTKEAQLKLDENEAEFEEYRRKALEKEQKLGRQLQDERNKALKAAKS